MLISAFFCFISLYVSYRRVKKLHKTDLSTPRGSGEAGIVYAFTAGMSPTAKESAYKHLPTFTSGILLHVGLFTAFLVSFFWPANNFLYEMLEYGASVILSRIVLAVLCVGVICGLSLFFKRMINKNLRYISNFDDFFSNIIITLFIISAILLIIFHKEIIFAKIMFIMTSLVFLYIPFGKLRHCLYFVLTRVYFGLFYGHRGVSPVSRKMNENGK